MLTFIFLGAGLVVAIFVVVLVYSANQRKRAGQSGQTEVSKQEERPQPRASGLD